MVEWRHEALAVLAGSGDQPLFYVPGPARLTFTGSGTGDGECQLPVADTRRWCIFDSGLGARLALALPAAPGESDSHPQHVPGRGNRLHGQQYLPGAHRRSPEGGNSQGKRGCSGFRLAGNDYRGARLRRRCHAGVRLPQPAGAGAPDQQLGFHRRHPHAGDRRCWSVPGCIVVLRDCCHVPLSCRTAGTPHCRAPNSPGIYPARPKGRVSLALTG